MADFTDTVSIEIQQSTKQTSTGIAKVVNDLKQLHSGMMVGITGVRDLQKQFQELNVTLGNSKLKSSISSINSDVLRYVTTNGQMVTVTRKAKNGLDSYAVSLKTVNKELDSTKNKNVVLPKPDKYGSMESQFSKLGIDLTNSKLISTLKDVNSEISKYKLKTGEVVTVQKKLVNGQEQVRVSIRNTNKDLNQHNSLWSAFTQGVSGAIVKLRIIYDTISNVAYKMGDIVDGASEYEEALNLFLVSMGKQAEDATAWVEKFSTALYLDPANVMQYMGSLNSLISGLGVGADKSYLMSKNLTQLAYDLASFKNMKFEEAFTKLQSGISGEIEPLRNVGVALSQNTLQELANSLGIQKRVAEMSEAEKAQLRYIQILKSTTQWQGDMGRTLVSPANAIRVLREQFTLLGRAIGRVFLPIIMEVLPYVMALTQILTDLANKIASFLGYEFTDIDYSSLGNISSGLGDIGDEAESTTKKLNTMLAPFDELNVVQSKLQGAGNGLGSIGGDLGVDLPEYDALAGLTDKFKNNVEEAKKNLSTILEIATLVGVAFASWKIAKGITTFMKTWKTIRGDFKKTVGLTLVLTGIAITTKGQLDIKEDFWKGLIEKLGGTALTGVGTYMLTKNIGVSLIITGLSLIIQSKIDEQTLDNTVLSSLEHLGGIATVAGGTFLVTKSVTITLLATLGIELISIGTSLQELQDLNPTFDEVKNAIGQMLFDFFSNIPVLSDIGEWLGEFTFMFVQTAKEGFENFIGIFEAFAKEAKYGWDSFWGGLGTFFTTFIETAVQGWNDFWDIIIDFIYAFGQEAINGWNDFWGMLGNAWGTISGWFNKTVIQPLSSAFSTLWNQLVKGGSTAWDGIKSVFSTVGSFFKTTFTNAWAGVKSVFTTGGKIFDGIKDGIVDAFKTIVNALINGINKVIATPFNKINDMLNTIRNVDILGVKPFKGLWKQNPIGIPKIPNLYAEGGFPKSGEFFIAREAGPEMVGKIGNQTAVANNDQITTSITNALITALNSYGFGNNQPGTTIVNIGGKKIYEGVGDYVDSENDRYGTNYVHV